MLKRIAKLAKQQGSFQLACKKYTQVCNECKKHAMLVCLGCRILQLFENVRLLSGHWSHISCRPTM